jgi:Zn-finger protein
MEHYKFYQNEKCEYFPCHKCENTENFNCLFCYCPLYALGDKCGGNFTYTEDGIKDCSSCLVPHKRGNYDYMMEKMGEIIELSKKP